MRTLGGRWAERRALVRRRMKAFTMMESSADRSCKKGVKG